MNVMTITGIRTQGGLGSSETVLEARASTDSEHDDREQFRASYAEHRDAVWRYFVRRVGDIDAADDLTSDVFVVAWRRRREAPTTALPWLYAVAGKVLAGDRRAARRRTALDARLAAHLVPEGAAPEGTAVGGTIVAEALSSLSPEERELLVLTAWEGLSSAELAVALGCRPSTARVRLHRARRRFAYHLSHLRHEGTSS